MTRFIDYEIKREQIHPTPRDPKRVAELAAAVNPRRNRLTLREKQEHCARLGVRPLDNDEIARLYPDEAPGHSDLMVSPEAIDEVIDQIEEEPTVKLDLTNFNKVKEKADRLAAVLKLREKLRAGEPFELIIGTGGTAQSIKLTSTFEEVVRNKMLHDLGADALQIAEEMRELGVAVDLPL